VDCLGVDETDELASRGGDWRIKPTGGGIGGGGQEVRRMGWRDGLKKEEFVGGESTHGTATHNRWRTDRQAR
jgi:hypothetical protein